MGLTPDVEVRLSTEEKQNFYFLSPMDDPQLKKALELLNPPVPTDYIEVPFSPAPTYVPNGNTSAAPDSGESGTLPPLPKNRSPVRSRLPKAPHNGEQKREKEPWLSLRLFLYGKTAEARSYKSKTKRKIYWIFLCFCKFRRKNAYDWVWCMKFKTIYSIYFIKIYCMYFNFGF